MPRISWIGGVGDWLARGVQSRWPRTVWWLVLTVLVSFAMANTIALTMDPISQIHRNEVFWGTFAVLAVTLGLTNALVILKSTYPIIDPRTDLRYHSRVCHLAKREESAFLKTLYRTGSPLDLEYTYEQTLVVMEQAVPFAILLTSSGLVMLVIAVLNTLDLLGVSLWDLPVPGFPFSLLPRELSTFTMWVLLLPLLYMGLQVGIFGPWSRYRKWRLFWIRYWKHVLNLLEPTKYGVEVSEEFGSWLVLLGMGSWGKLGDLNSDKSNAKIRAILRKKIGKEGLHDKIPDDMPASKVIQYGDRLAILMDIRHMLKENSKDFKKLAKNSHKHRELAEEIKSIKSLRGNAPLEFLRSALKEIILLPITQLSLFVLEEIKGIASIEDEKKKDLMEIAQSRLDALWALPHSPLPGSLKWMGFFYSIAGTVGVVVSLLFA